MSKMHENAFPRAHCLGILRLLSETSLRVNSHWVTFLWILLTDSQVK